MSEEEEERLQSVKDRKRGKYIKVLMWDEKYRSSLSTGAKSVTAANKIIMRYQKYYPNWTLSLIADDTKDYYNEVLAINA